MLNLEHQDLQICVSKSNSAVATGLLCSTDLFEVLNPSQDAETNKFTEYKHGFLHDTDLDGATRLDRLVIPPLWVQFQSKAAC